MKQIKDKKGFTLIELIVVLGLAGIVISVVMSFFISNYRSYETINTESELQYQSQYIINFMTNKILEAEDFDGMTPGVDEAKFIYRQAGEEKKFKFKLVGDEIIYTDIYDIPSPPVGKYVKAFTVISEGENRVKIVLTLDKGDNSDDYPAEQIVYMRNSQ